MAAAKLLATSAAHAGEHGGLVGYVLANVGMTHVTMSILAALGDVNTATDPLIYQNVYTNGILAKTVETILQYALNTCADSSVSHDNSAGVPKIVGAVNTDAQAADPVTAASFDIVSPE